MRGFGMLELAGIVHKDLRMRNLMITKDGLVKIIGKSTFYHSLTAY